jgi:hypothetical protein
MQGCTSTKKATIQKGQKMKPEKKPCSGCVHYEKSEYSSAEINYDRCLRPDRLYFFCETERKESNIMSLLAFVFGMQPVCGKRGRFWKAKGEAV